MVAKRMKYSPEFKAALVREVIDASRPIADVARENGVVSQTLGNWVKAYRRAHVDDEPELSVSEREELKALRDEIRELRMEKQFLGKAAAFFAKECR